MFKYAICNETFQGWTWEATCKQTAESGYSNIEVAPFTLAEDIRALNSGDRRKLREMAEACGLEVIGLHWLLVSPKGLSITSDDAPTRDSTGSFLTALVEFCADLGGKTMVLGSPAQRRLPTTDTCGDQSPSGVAADRLTAVLSPVLKRCSELNVTLCLEPLPAPEADFVLTLAEAASIVTQIDHPNLKTMLDVKSASSEHVPISELIYKYHKLIKHVHVNDANRRGPGFGDTDFVPILRALSQVGYEGPVSVEVFDYSPDPVTIAEQSLAYLRKSEEEER